MRLVVIGCGRFAERRIAPALRDAAARAAGVELLGFASRTRARAEDYVARLGGRRAYQGLDEVAADPAVDACWLATPDGAHVADTRALLAAGKHVLCEKPVALAPGEVEALFDAADAAGRHLAAAHQAPFHPANEALAAAVASGELGPLGVISMRLGSPGRGQHRAWGRDPALSGGPWLDAGAHLASVAVELFAAAGIEPAPASADAVAGDPEPVLLGASWRWPGGLGRLEVLALPLHGGELVASGPARTVRITGSLQQLASYTWSSLEPGAAGWTHRTAATPDCYARLVADFAGAVHGEAAAPRTGRDHAVAVYRLLAHRPAC